VLLNQHSELNSINQQLEVSMSDKSSFSAVNALISALDEMQAVPQHHDESSWVAGSGKAELYVRDRLGATLSKQFPDLVVAREWGKNKHDLAILDRQAQPLVVMEGKHLFDFDLFVPSYREKYRRSILKDRLKMKDSGTDQQLISLLMTSFRGEVPAHLSKVFKYGGGSNRWYKKHGSDLMHLAVKEADSFLSEFGTIVHQRQLSAGRFCGLDVCSWIWLVDSSK
jgi:hypothetical protein